MAEKLSATVNPKNKPISEFILAAPLEGAAGNRRPVHRYFAAIGAADDAFSGFALATAGIWRNIRRRQLSVAFQAPVIVTQDEPSASARIAGEALAAQFARHVAQATARLVAEGTCGQ
ncbi:MAG: hypothetical protein CVU33_18745 [Betaproteobacteria bacterium HGW-Betaproteobacteria-6]|nr:MAG: hypothetical protein CVU33_18745 [Betaproteobacteria bacterium HGW-Betaproteobacteria-6]